MMMFKYVIHLTAVSVFISLFAFPIIAEEIPADLAKLINTLNVNECWQIKFQQSNHNVTSGQTILANGRVYFKAPNSFRWDYESSPQNVIAGSSQSVTMLLVHEKTAMIDSTGQTAILLSPISIFTGHSSLSEHFKVKETSSSESPVQIFELLPTSTDRPYEKLTIEVKKGFGNKEFSLTIYDLAGNRNRLEFQGYKPCQTQPEFNITIPSGYQTTDFSGNPIPFGKPIP